MNKSQSDHSKTLNQEEEEEKSLELWFDLIETKTVQTTQTPLPTDSSSLPELFATSNDNSKSEERRSSLNSLRNQSIRSDKSFNSFRNFGTNFANSKQRFPKYRQQKPRIIWGKEIPNMCTLDLNRNICDSNNNNYVMTMGSNPLITIKPINNKDDNSVITSLIHYPLSSSSSSSMSSAQYSPSRVFELENLRNYFKLNEPELMDNNKLSINTGRFRHEYFLSLLDPTMPRLTNCGKYYRMRYAVYVSFKDEPSRLLMNWRKTTTATTSDISSNSKKKVIHIGEIHLYTIFDRNHGFNDNPIRKVTPTPTTTTLANDNHNKILLPLIHYENISFFLNQHPLSRDEQRILQCNNEMDFNHIGNNFRRYLKYLNSIIVTIHNPNHLNMQPSLSAPTISNVENFNSTYLLEQLKYPKSSDQFINPDQSCEQFMQLQQMMLTRYHQQQQKNNEDEDGNDDRDVDDENETQQQQQPKSLISSSSRFGSESFQNNKEDFITSDMFVQNLNRLASMVQDRNYY